MKIVLDTNVLVSGLLNPTGTPGRILDLVTTGAVSVVYDDRILAEYREVLARPRLRIEPIDAALVVEQIEKGGLLVPAPPTNVELPDPLDLPFAEVAAAAGTPLVTGNGRHFKPVRGTLAVAVLTPSEFMDGWRERRLG